MAYDEEAIDLEPLCYFPCEGEATDWIKWTLHEVPQVFGGGAITTEIGVCADHFDMITDTMFSISCLPDSRKVS